MNKNSHSVHDLKCHLVLVTKYRKKVITDDISAELKEVFSTIATKYGISINEWNHDEDHIHALMDFSPSTDFVKFINSSKSASSRIIKKKFPDITKNLWKECFWSRSYYLSTVGHDETVISGYIRSQGEK